MPTYEYACTDCGNEWEEIQKIVEPALEDCPKCGKKTAKRLITGGTFILKGGGWYADLYSSSKPSEPKGSGTSATKEGGSSEGGAKAESPAGGGEAAKPAATSTTPTGGGSSSSKE